MLGRAFRRECPRCGTDAFTSWFTMKEACSNCGHRFEREPGYWVGAVIINTTIVFATFLIVFGGLVLATWPEVPWVTVLVVTAIANVTAPIVLYPLSKTIWMALELSWHPLEDQELAAAHARVEGQV